MDSSKKKEMLGCRVNPDIVAKLIETGNKGKAGASIIHKFFYVSQFEKYIPKNGVILSMDNGQLYPTSVGQNLFHITTKKADREIVVVLDKQKAAEFALQIIKLINQEQEI